MMKILAINGSPRKNGRTGELLIEALKASEEVGVQTTLIHLADYNIQRCRGCYACTRGPCPQQDEMAGLLAEIHDCQADGLLYGAPVFNFNLPGLLVDFWNRKTGLSGYFRAKEEGNLDGWLARNRVWKAGAGITLAGHSGGQKTSLKHINFALLGEVERVLPGVTAHTRHWDRALNDATHLGHRLARALRTDRGPYPLWQMPFVYKHLTCFEFPRV